MKVLNSNEANAVIALTAQELRDIKEAVYLAIEEADYLAIEEADASDAPNSKPRADRLEKIYNQL